MPIKLEFVYKTKRVKEPNHKVIGKAVRHVRSTLGLQQSALANHMDISACYLSDLEQGKRNWTRELFDKAVFAINWLGKNGK